MRTIVAFFVVMLLCAYMSAQQSPPADGVGLGNAHTSASGSVSASPSISPDQNQAATGTQGSTTGDRNDPTLAGSSGSQTASSTNSQGTVGASSSTAATAARRRASHRKSSTKKGTGMRSATGQQQGKQASKAGAGQDKLLSPNMGPSTTEAPGPSTGNKPRQVPPRD